MRFLDNPRRTATRGKRKAKAKRRRTAAQRAATRRMVAANKKRRGAKSRRITSTGASNMATRRKRRSGARKSVARRKVRRSSVRRASARRRSSRRRSVMVGGRVYTSNPNLTGMLTRGVMDAAVAVAGKTAARFVGSKLPALVAGQAGQIINAVISAAAIGFLGARFLGNDRARVMVQGALQAPIETALQPVISRIGLASYAGATSLRAYPAAPMLSSYAGAGQPRALAGYEGYESGVFQS